MNSKSILLDVLFLVVFLAVVSTAFFMPKQTKQIEEKSVVLDVGNITPIIQINKTNTNETVIKGQTNLNINKSCMNKTGCDVIQ